MLTILIHSSASRPLDGLQEACQAALDTVLPVSQRPQVRWLNAIPAGAAAAGAAEQPGVDLLLSNDNPASFARLLDTLRPRPTLAVLVVGPENNGHVSPADPAVMAATHELLTWPCPPDLLGAHVAQWVARIRQLRSADQLEDRITELTRQNSTLRRQVTRYTRQMELRDRNDADLRLILSRVDGITRLCQQISSLQLEQVAGMCIERIPSLLSVRLVSLYLYDPDQRMLRLARHNHPYPINPAVYLDDQPAGPMAIAVAQRQPLVIHEPYWGTVPLVPGTQQGGQSPFPQTAAEMGTVPARPFAHRYQTSHCVIVPLCAEDRVVGVLNLADKEDRRPFDELTDLLPIRQLSELLGASIRNIELYRAVQQQAQTDSLTGLANRAKFTRELGREINRAARYGSPLSLILADLDSLKRINDQFGHLAGDRAIQLAARTIAQSIRESDLAARHGGDEFAILLPSTKIDAARQVADRIVSGVAASGASIGGTGGAINAGGAAGATDSAAAPICAVAVTISVGVGQYDGRSTAEQFLEQVDQTLYQAKSAGRSKGLISENRNSANPLVEA